MIDVLIVDDSPADRTLFRNLLGRAGFAIHEASTGGEALTRAVEARPHVIVLDVNLPDTDGHTVCRALKADPRTAGLPVLMLTVRDDADDVTAGLEAGADDYVAKDAAVAVILARVRRLARYRQMAESSALNLQLAQVGRLLAGIVHEIRGPLSVIRGHAELLRLAQGGAPTGPDHLEPIIRSTRVLQARLEHLMASVRGGAAVRVPLEVGPLVEEAVDLFRKGSGPAASKVGVTVEVAAKLPIVAGDAGRLLQVFLNLLINAQEAILAHQPGGSISVLVVNGPEADGGLCVEFRDDGPGIPETHLNRIFEPFYTTKSAGTGYGLYLASEILIEHLGKLQARNLEPVGACLTLWLPATAPPAEATP